jgi:hypothetical protein
MECLVLTNETIANQAKRKIEANFIRNRSNNLDTKGYGKLINNIDPNTLNDDQINDNYTWQIPGFKNGEINLVNGFTIRWCEYPKQRLDGKWVIPLPDDENLKQDLLFAVPQPNNIETYDKTWFAQEGV